MTGTRSVEIDVDGRVLTIVPAVHYRVAFAEAVNAIACSPQTRPDAIAVEMGPGLAAVTAGWLQEIGIGPDRRVALPCLLGLTVRARYLSPSVRERALELQVEWGQELADIPPEVLEVELDYRALGLVALSPTDSIVEAVRCGCELDVPILGVDLEEVAPVPRAKMVVPDASRATGRVAAYSAEVAALIGAGEVALVDRRRERAMAARLKGLLQSHDRVLFTCGLAHWERVAELVRDPTIEPAWAAGNARELSGRYRRQLIHPTLAFQFLDCLPLVAWLFERRRRHPLLNPPGPAAGPVPVARVFDAKLRQCVRGYVSDKGDEEVKEARGAAKVGILADFPDLVRAHAAFGLREVPQVGDVLRCAKAFVGNGFATQVAKNMMRFPWASPRDFPDCDTLLPAESRPSASSVVLLRRGRVLGESTRVRGLDELECVGVADDLDSQSWRDAGPKPLRQFGISHTWTPWERLTSGLSDEAVALAMRTESPPAVEPFRGSLQSGIAPRETLRSRARGEKGLYVFGRRRQDGDSCSDMTEGWPVVWIFDAGPAAGGEWTELGLPLSWMTPLARDSAAFKRSYGRYRRMAAIIAFGHHRPGPGSKISISRLSGLLLFSPVFDDMKQYTRWVEMTAGRRNAWVRGLNLGALPSSLLSHCEAQGHPVGHLAWQHDIVRMAIPFARTGVTVVLPDRFQLHPVVQEEAIRMGKHLRCVSLERFDAAEIERVRTKQGVPGYMSGRVTEYPPQVSKTIGEPQHRYAERLPYKWRRFGL